MPDTPKTKQHLVVMAIETDHEDLMKSAGAMVGFLSAVFASIPHITRVSFITQDGSLDHVMAFQDGCGSARVIQDGPQNNKLRLPDEG